MSLEKAILHKKEKRGRRRKGCPGYCTGCMDARRHKSTKQIERLKDEQKEIL